MVKARILNADPAVWGSMSGRGCHPADPTGSVFGKAHWPLPAPHERGQEDKKRVPAATTPADLKAKRDIRLRGGAGLSTLADFKAEARTLGVADRQLLDKLDEIWAKSLPNEALRKMQCNNALKSAIKRRGNA